jgi:uncharacterized metal-binding protein YceD (DUF177 family)
MNKSINPWSVQVTLEQIPETGLHCEIAAPAEACAAIAQLAGLRGLQQLSATFDLVRRGTGVAANGRVQARVEQTCVVTLEPIENTVDEPIDIVFAPPGAAEFAAGEALGAAEEVPEVLVDDKIDLGALATEFLMLGIDPYPRKAGAQFVPPKADESGRHPFAALAVLKKRPGGGQD